MNHYQKLSITINKYSSGRPNPMTLLSINEYLSDRIVNHRDHSMPRIVKNEQILICIFPLLDQSIDYMCQVCF